MWSQEPHSAQISKNQDKYNLKNQGKKTKSFKAENIERLSPRSTCYCFSQSRASKI